MTILSGNPFDGRPPLSLITSGLIRKRRNYVILMKFYIRKEKLRSTVKSSRVRGRNREKHNNPILVRVSINICQVVYTDKCKKNN